MEKQICEWLLADENPEVKLRTLKEYLKFDDKHPEVLRARENLLKSLGQVLYPQQSHFKTELKEIKMAIQSIVEKGKEQGKSGEGFPGLSN